MSKIKKINVILRSSCDAHGPLETACWISRVSGSKITVLIRPGMPGGASAIEKRLKLLGVPLTAVRIIYSRGSLSSSLNQEMRESNGQQLVVAGSMECGPGSGDLLDSETVELIEGCSDPVLLFPFRQAPQVPWKLIVTPMSGEIRANRALSRAIELANQLRVPVEVIHVVDPQQSDQYGAMAVGRFGDQAHHEIHAMIDEFISQACPFCTQREKRVIRDFHLVHGTASEEIPRLLSGKSVGVVAVEWKGSFMQGHAETLKEMLRTLQAPVLLVRQRKAHETPLRAGHRLKVS
ncbi:universal stress protein [bacterium]|nr:universal stress protein [bacterium]